MKNNLLLFDIFNTICNKHGNRAVAALYRFSENGTWYIFIIEMDDSLRVINNKVLTVFETNELKAANLVPLLGDEYPASEITIHFNTYISNTGKLLKIFEESHNPIKDLREITGLSQQAFADKYGIPFNTIRNWESTKNSSRHRECPEYVFRLLSFIVFYDYRTDMITRNISDG